MSQPAAADVADLIRRYVFVIADQTSLDIQKIEWIGDLENGLDHYTLHIAATSAPGYLPIFSATTDVIFSRDSFRDFSRSDQWVIERLIRPELRSLKEKVCPI